MKVLATFFLVLFIFKTTWAKPFSLPHPEDFLDGTHICQDWLESCLEHGKEIRVHFVRILENQIINYGKKLEIYGENSSKKLLALLLSHYRVNILTAYNSSWDVPYKASNAISTNSPLRQAKNALELAVMNSICAQQVLCSRANDVYEELKKHNEIFLKKALTKIPNKASSLGESAYLLSEFFTLAYLSQEEFLVSLFDKEYQAKLYWVHVMEIGAIPENICQKIRSNNKLINENFSENTNPYLISFLRIAKGIQTIPTKNASNVSKILF